jgi:TM2 domain-containing membrane protein YozV
MYKIIGGDGREYGPVSADQLRQWVTEGRANATTRVQGEGTAEWIPLSTLFPEMFGVAAPPVVGAAPPQMRTRPPGADRKIAAGVCGILLGEFGIHKFILGYTSEGVTMLLISLLTCGIGWVVMKIFGLIEGIIYLTKSDDSFVATYVLNKKGWF